MAQKLATRFEASQRELVWFLHQSNPDKPLLTSKAS